MNHFVNQLNDFINQHFNLDEIKELCFTLEVDFDELGGEKKSTKVQNLLLLLYRERNLDKLQVRLCKLRPNPFKASGIFLEPDVLEQIYNSPYTQEEVEEANITNHIAEVILCFGKSLFFVLFKRDDLEEFIYNEYGLFKSTDSKFIDSNRPSTLRFGKLIWITILGILLGAFLHSHNPLFELDNSLNNLLFWIIFVFGIWGSYVLGIIFIIRQLKIDLNSGFILAICLSIISTTYVISSFITIFFAAVIEFIMLASSIQISNLTFGNAELSIVVLSHLFLSVLLLTFFIITAFKHFFK